MASIDTTKANEKNYNFKWKIPKWDEIQNNIDQVVQQTFTFETLLFPSSNASWEIGFFKKKKDVSICSVIFYQKLIKLPVAFKEVNSSIKITLLSNDGAGESTSTEENRFEEKRVHTFETGFYLPGHYSTFMDDTGCITFAIKLTLRFSPDLNKPSTNSLIWKEFNNVSTLRTCKNWALLLRDMNCSDLKIITRDDQEILAHKLVLKVQCPIFASNYPTEFAENSFVTVKTTEISGKTMKVLLHYFYCGEVLESWREDNVIVEFTAAVAKYKMQEVAEILDQVLGKTEEQRNWENDWKLMTLVREMSLKRAEKRLNDRILRTARSVRNADELLTLFRRVVTINENKKEEGMLVRVKPT